jgi:hypothetical protein
MNRIRRVATGGVLAAAAITGGAVGAGLVGTANAQTTTNSSSGGTSSTSPAIPAHGSTEHESAEKPVTGDAATHAQTAAVTAEGGGTAGDVTTDFTGTGYEVTVTKTDGTQVEVHLDSSFNVEQHGPGGGRLNDNDADDQAPGSSSSAAN